MKHKILWMLTSFLLVAALVLASCAPAVPGEQEEEEEEEEEEPVGEQEEEEEEEEEEEPAVGEPIRGGTLNWGHLWCHIGEEYVTFTPKSLWQRTWHFPYMETLLVGDVEKYGPRGTNECPFLQCSDVPESYWGGHLAESWEVSVNEMVFHIRPGVMWAGREGVMEPRELTADDVAYSLQFQVGPEAAISFPFIDSITATDRYTVVLATSYFDTIWFKTQPAWWHISPPEVEEAGWDDWRNQVGTGPFILTDYVPGSLFAYERNPLYWGTTTINGKEYQLPFIDKLIFPVIVDESTRMAALRTGTLEYLAYVRPVYTKTLDVTCPDMLKVLHNDDASLKLNMNCSKPPFSDINVRRAMHIATDLEAINDAMYFGQGVIHNCPQNPFSTDVYIPLEELSLSAQELYEYDPDKALDMLALAGYSEGFEVEMIYTTGSPDDASAIALLTDQWAKVNVEVIPAPREAAATMSLVYGVGPGYTGATFQDTLLFWNGNDPPISIMDNLMMPKGSGKNFCQYYGDEWWMEHHPKARETLDYTERVALIKELSRYYVDLVVAITFPQPPAWSYWWPWLKNYYGELNVSHRNDTPIIARIWIDQELKESMGY